MSAVVARACEDCGALHLERVNDGWCRGCGARVVPIGEINPDLKAVPAPRRPWWKRWLPAVTVRA